MKKIVSFLLVLFLAGGFMILCSGQARASVTAVADATLSLSANPTSSSVGGQNFDVTAAINPGSNTTIDGVTGFGGINTTEIDVSFDANVVHFVSATIIDPATFTLVSKTTVNNANSTGKFQLVVMSSNPALTTTANIATLVFSPFGTGNNSAISLDNTSDATFSGTGEHVVATRTGTVVTVNAAPTYTVGGTVSNLVGSVVLQNNGGDNITVNSSGSFTFATALASGNAYNATVLTNPNNQTCTVTNGSGTIASSNVTNVQVNCVTNPTYSLGGTVSGLGAGKTLVLNDSQNTFNVTSNGSATFFTGYYNANPYDVTIQTQPVGQTCNITNASGTIAAANVTNIAISCTNIPVYTVSGNVSGLNGTLLLSPGAQGIGQTQISSNGQQTLFDMLDGTSYTIAVASQPAGQTCVVSNGSGTISGANIANVTVTCTDNPKHAIGGNVSGLAGGTLILQNNGGDNISISANGNFTFVGQISEGATYNVTVLTQPADEICTVSNGSGTMSTSDITNISVTCVDAPAVISGGSPMGTLATGTTQVTVSVTTSENATCKYSTTSGNAYASMTNNFTDNGTTHSFTATGLQDSGSYNYYVRCQDTSNTVNTSDYWISFSVGSSVVVASENSNDDKSSNDSKEEVTPPRSVSNSKKTVKNGDILIQRGKKFSKKTQVLLYFEKPSGGYYAPTKITTSSKGTFTVTYRVNKPKGKYGWYAVDTKTGKKSKITYYKVR